MRAPIPLPAFNPGPMTGEGNHTYLLVGSNGGATLIDAGIGEARHIAAIEAELSASHARLEQILVTHAHGDHASGAAALARTFPGAQFRKQLWPAEDARYPVEWLPLADGEAVAVGEDHLTVLFTPGHSPDHVAFWHEESRTAFTGDLVVAGTTVMIAASKGGDLRQYLSSLERIRALQPRRLLPAHGDEITDTETIVARYFEHRARREEQVLEALSAGHATVQAVTESIYHGLPRPLFQAASENVRAHLEKLRQDGRAHVEDDRWGVKQR